MFLGLSRPWKEGTRGLELVCLHPAPAPTHLDLEWLFLYTPADSRVGPPEATLPEPAVPGPI